MMMNGDANGHEIAGSRVIHWAISKVARKHGMKKRRSECSHLEFEHGDSVCDRKLASELIEDISQLHRAMRLTKTGKDLRVMIGVLRGETMTAIAQELGETSARCGQRLKRTIEKFERMKLAQ